MKLNFPRKESGLYEIPADNGFDTIAVQILTKKQPAVLETAMPLDMDKLIYDSYLECKSEFLSKSGNVWGLVTFSDMKIPTYDENFNKTFVEAQEGTIFVERRLKNLSTRYRFTQAHEYGHWIVGRGYFSSDKRDYNFRKEGCSFVVNMSEAIGHKNPKEAKNDEELSEWQADSLAAALLMPSVTFIPKVNYLLKGYGFESSYIPLGTKETRAHALIGDVARTYGVSARSAKIRMMSCNFIKAM